VAGDRQSRIDDLTLAGGTVWLRMSGTGTNDGSFMRYESTGRLMRTDVFGALRVGNRRVVEHWGVPGRLGALFQLGLARPPGRPASAEANRRYPSARRARSTARWLS
jgi:hypothetical protein